MEMDEAVILADPSIGLGHTALSRAKYQAQSMRLSMPQPTQALVAVDRSHKKYQKYRRK